MLEGMLGAALLIAAFGAGYVFGSKKRPPKGEAKPETVEEIKRKRNFKHFMNYDGSGNTD